jgi:hypothetical protein
MTVTRRIRRRGEHGISRKTIVQGMPGCSDCTCMLVCACYVHFCTRDRGCSKHPAFPAPSVGREIYVCLGRTAPREGERMVDHRHCEPTGRANARPMTGSAKQSISPRKERMDCFAALAMTWISRCHPSRHRPPTGRPNGRPMTGSGGRSSIPESSAIEPRSRGVLDTRLRGYDSGGWARCCFVTS